MTWPDNGLFVWVNGVARHTAWLHAPALDFASYGVVVFGVLLLVGWWLARGRGTGLMARALWAPLGVLLAVAVNQPLSHLVHEPRPYTAMHHILVLTHRSADWSFPSDHATMAGAAVLGLFLVDRWLGAIGAVAALVLCISRVYVAAHYPHDVLAGLVVGALVSWLGYLLVGALLQRLVAALVRTPLRPLVLRQREPSLTAG